MEKSYIFDFDQENTLKDLRNQPDSLSWLLKVIFVQVSYQDIRRSVSSLAKYSAKFVVQSESSSFLHRHDFIDPHEA